MEDKILNLLVDKNEISWKTMLFELVETNGMDPWNVNISLLSQMYIERLKQFKELDLKISGKVVLAASILLRIKSKRLVGEDMSEFDRLLASTEQTEGEFYDTLEQELNQGEKKALEGNYELFPKMPQPRKRKVSIYDLVSALEKALEVKRRRFDRFGPVEMKLPEMKFDITSAVKNVFERFTNFFKEAGQKINFKQLLPSERKEDKVYTFIPLLHLANQEKVELEQEKPFSEIFITPGKNSVQQNPNPMEVSNETKQ